MKDSLPIEQRGVRRIPQDLALIERLRRERDRYKRALKSIEANSCCDKCQEAALVAREALSGVGS